MPIKPPAGLKPRWLVEQERINDIIRAIDRYLAAGVAIPREWIEELTDLVHRYNTRYAKGKAEQGEESDGDAESED